MADERENYFKLSGVIYDKPVKEGTSKKTGQPYSIQTIVLERKSRWDDKDGKSHEKTDLIEFKLTKNAQATLGMFSAGDHVIFNFSMAGRKFDGKNGSFYINEPTCSKIDFADIDSNGQRPNVSTNNGSSLPAAPPLPDPETGYDDMDDDLPF